MEKIEKKISQAKNGKKVFLLGIDEYGSNVWLEAASFDCGWYWGFGYIETYEGNKAPNIARDIDSHSHYDSSIWSSRNVKGDFVYHINMMDWKASTLTDGEAWKLSELMREFYCLRETAQLFDRGSMNICDAGFPKDELLSKRINEVLLPAIFEKVYSLLSPIK